MSNTSAKEGTLRGNWPEHVLLATVESLGCKCLSPETICHGFCQGTRVVLVPGPPLQGRWMEGPGALQVCTADFRQGQPYPEHAQFILKAPVVELPHCGGPGLWCLPPLTKQSHQKKKLIRLILSLGQKQLPYSLISILSHFSLVFVWQFIFLSCVCVYIYTHEKKYTCTCVNINRFYLSC